MDAILLFSGGKDSVLAYKKAVDAGYNIVASFTYIFSDEPDVIVETPVSQAISTSIGVPDYIAYPFTIAQIAARPLPEMLTERLIQLKATYPTVQTLILGADASQAIVMYLFYLRIAHAAGLTVYAPYASSYDTEFFDDMRANNLEVRLIKFPDTLENPPAYNRGDVLPIDMLETAFLENNLPIVSETQTIVTNGSFFNSPVLVRVVNGVIQLQ